VPSQASLGRSGPAAVRQQFTLAGRQMRAAGIDVDLAPVADLGVPGGFEGSRTFPGPSGTVAGLVQAAVSGLRAGGVAATAKHFPGLAGVRTNTDDGSATGRPVGGADLVPFRAAVAAKVPLVMVDLAHHQGLGPRPAALSAASYHILRDKVGFRGIAITDSLSARAARAVGPETVTAVQAVCAGADLVIAQGGPAQAAAVVDALQAAERSGALPRSRVASALARVSALADR
jgi:beta-N-acetylhexosaminidase